MNRYVPVFLAERAIPLRRTASRTIEMRFTRVLWDKLALSHRVMICAPARGRAAFRVGAKDRNGREHSEDGADDHISDKPARSLCGRKRAGTVSERRSPGKWRRDARTWRRSEQILPTKDFASVWLTCSLRGNQSFHDGRGSCMVPILKPFVEVEAKF